MQGNLQVEGSLLLHLLQLPPPTVVHPHLVRDQCPGETESIDSIQNENISNETDPSNPVVVLASGAKEPKALIGVLSEQALLPPRAPGQHHLEQQHQRDLVQKITS